LRPDLNRRPAGLDFILWIALILASVVLGLPTAGSGQIPITVNGHDRVVGVGTTFADAIAQFHIRARSGDLLDVNGNVFEAAVSRGRILIDGHARLRRGLLRAGDDIRSINGRDRAEPTVRITRRVGRQKPGNPQFYIESIPGRETIIAGRYSHEVVRVSFHPLGRMRPDKAVALTFDDGPSPANTPKILAVLKQFHVKATFFLIGLNAKRYPKLVQVERNAGMAVANHTWSHPIRPTFARLGDKRIHDEIALCTSAIEEVAPTPGLFRPSGGSLSPNVVRIAKQLGMRVVLWSVDPKDWRRGTPPGVIAARVLGAIKPGAIVDMHDGGANGANTAAALPAIIKGIRARGLKVVALRA
jgi:peptidoglycan-N-acetylglucosamine deacetylase